MDLNFTSEADFIHENRNFGKSPSLEMRNFQELRRTAAAVRLTAAAVRLTAAAVVTTQKQSEAMNTYSVSSDIRVFLAVNK